MQNVFGPTPVATSGVCVFGQGDCGPKVNNVSQSFNQTLTENIKNTLVSKSTSVGAVMASEQIVDFSGADLSNCEEVTISGVSQKAVLNYNFSMLESSYDETQFSNMVRSNVEKTLNQKAEAKSEALNGGNAGTVNNITQNYNNSVDRLVNSINYNDFKNIMSEMRARQKISFAGMTLGGRFCNITNISQDVMMDMAARMVSEKVSKEFVQIAKENALKETTTSENKFMASGVLGDLGRGISGITTSLFTGLGNLVGEFTKPFIMIAIVILVCIVAYVIYRAMMSGKLEGFAKDPNAPPQPPQVAQDQQLGAETQTFEVAPQFTDTSAPSAPSFDEMPPQAEQLPLITPPQTAVIPESSQQQLQDAARAQADAVAQMTNPTSLQAGVATGQYEGDGFIDDATAWAKRSVGTASNKVLGFVDGVGSRVTGLKDNILSKA